MSSCEKEKSKIKRLKETIRILNSKLAVFTGIQTAVHGTEGENFILELIKGGSKIHHNASYDLVTKKRNRIEMKTAKCLPVFNNKETPCKRWGWRYVIRANKKRKYYDYLILMGEKDERYDYNDSTKTPYVYFFLSYEQVKKLITSNDEAHFNLTTNFASVRSKQGRALIDKYRVTYRGLMAILKKI